MSNAQLAELPESEMAWAVPQYNRGLVDSAGDALARSTPSDEDFEQNLIIIDNWRSSHAFPLHCVKRILLQRARKLDPSATIAQRLKRLSSIHLKLRRFKDMRLSQMQDLGGCRAIVRSVNDIEKLVGLLESGGRSSHGLVLVKKKDYIRSAKVDGYRGVHLIYKYQATQQKHSSYNDLRIEMQLRSRLQHAWATAVETVGVFTGQALKSNIGEESWLRFFALMGSAIAQRENRSLVPGTPTDALLLRKELRDITVTLKIEDLLEAMGYVVMKMSSGKKTAHAFLLVLDPIKREISISSFQENELARASQMYLLKEKEIAAQSVPTQAVLVSVSSLKSLRTAYPNYYLDTRVFREALRQAIAEESLS